MQQATFPWLLAISLIMAILAVVLETVNSILLPDTCHLQDFIKTSNAQKQSN